MVVMIMKPEALIVKLVRSLHMAQVSAFLGLKLKENETVLRLLQLVEVLFAREVTSVH